MSANGYAEPHSWQHLTQGLGKAQIMGKLGNWLAHMNIWRQMTTASAFEDHSEWSIIVEDDTLVMDDPVTLRWKINATISEFPEVDIIYMTGREMPYTVEYGRLGYVGTDAYAIRHSAAHKILSFCLLNHSLVTDFALDAHLTKINGLGLISARTLIGGNAFVNRWHDTPSEIDTP